MPLFGRRPPAVLSPARAGSPPDQDALRVDVRSQGELLDAVAAGRIPVLVAPEDYLVGAGTVVEAQARARVYAVEDARVLAREDAVAFAADDAVVTARDEASARLFGRARATLYDRAAGRAFPATEQPFPDGSSHRTTGVDVELHDRAVLESWAPLTARADGDAQLILHGTSYEMTAQVTGRAYAQLLGEAAVSADGDAFLYVSAGRVEATGRAVVVVNPFVGGTSAHPQVRADGDVVVVGDSGVVEGSGRPVSVAEVSSVDGWLALWGLMPARDTVDLFVGVRPGDGEVMDPSWFDRAYLSPGDRLPDGIPVTARRNTWPMGPRGVRLLTVRVPVAALRPGSHIDALAMATAAEGVVVA